jgi:phosphoribosylanthranilate isomerase
MKVRAKLCGLTTEGDIDAAAAAGAAYIGLVFFEKSPRNVTVETARSLALRAPVGLAKVALVVNADDAALDHITASVPLDMLQLHGAETPERVAAVKARYGLPVMKALGIASRADVARAQLYSGVAINCFWMPNRRRARLCRVAMAYLLTGACLKEKLVNAVDARRWPHAG